MLSRVVSLSQSCVSCPAALRLRAGSSDSSAPWFCCCWCCSFCATSRRAREESIQVTHKACWNKSLCVSFLVIAADVFDLVPVVIKPRVRKHQPDGGSSINNYKTVFFTPCNEIGNLCRIILKVPVLIQKAKNGSIWHFYKNIPRMVTPILSV